MIALSLPFAVALLAAAPARPDAALFKEAQQEAAALRASSK